MLDITTELKDLYKTDYLPYRSEPVQKDLKFTFTDPVLVIENDKIVAGSFDLQESLNSNEDLVFGSCEASTLKVKFADITEDINGKTFALTQTVNGTVINLGTFTVDSAIEQDSRRFLEVTAYDNMRKFDRDVVDWYESLSFPTHLKHMRESLCNYCGVEFEDSNLPNDTMSVTKTISSNTLNGLEVLRSLEQINGAFGHIGRDGKLQHKVLSKTVVDDTIPSGSYKKLKYEKYSTKPIDKLQINQEDGDVGAIVGTGTNCYKIQDNFLVYGKSASALQTIADNAAINILGVTYVPYTCEMLGLPYLEVGDRVTYGTSITSYILSRNIKGIQSITDAIETKGNEEIIQVTSINTEVKQLRGKTNVLSRDVEKMESTITEFDKQINVLLPGPWYPDGSLLPCQNNMTNLEYELNSKILQTAKEITTEVNNVSEQLNTKITQTATSITAQVNNLAANTSAQFAITDAEISTKVEKNGVISAINQTAESITISANKINFNGVISANGNFKVTTSGDLEATSAKLINAYFTNGIYYEYSGLRFPIFEVPSQGILQIANSATHCKFMGSIEARNAVFTNLSVNGSSVLTSSTYATDLRVSLSTSPTYPGTYYLSFNNTSGDENVPTMGWVKARQASDERLKKNIKPLDVEKEYMKLNPVQYKFKKNTNNNKVHFGFVAQEIAESYDEDKYNIVEYDTEIVTEGERKYVKDGVYRINYEDMHAMHVMMIQKLYKKISDLEEMICI